MNLRNGAKARASLSVVHRPSTTELLSPRSILTMGPVVR